MLIVTHEMRLARDVSSRIFFMDQGGIYEDGTPQQIFENPQKERTRNFIYRIRSWEYSIDRDVDIYAMMGNLEAFCQRQFMGKKPAAKCQLAVEELTASVLLPVLQENPGKTVSLRLNAGEEGKEMTLEVNYKSLSDQSAAFEKQADDISLAIMKKMLTRLPDEDPDTAVFRIG